MSASAAQWHCPAFSLLTRWPESTPALAFAFQETHVEVSIGVNVLNTFLLCLFCCDAWDWRLPTNNINSRLDSVNVNSIFVLRSKSVSHLSRDSVTLSLCDTSRHVTRDTWHGTRWSHHTCPAITTFSVLTSLEKENEAFGFINPSSAVP